MPSGAAQPSLKLHKVFQVTVPKEDTVMINGVPSAVVPTYQCVRTVQNGLYRQQLTYPCKPRVSATSKEH